MSGRNPHEIWDETVDEGERRLTRGVGGMLSTSALGGVDVMLGVMALAVVSGGLGEVLPESVAHLGGSLAFGIGFVLVVIGRSELFTENFLVPVGAVLQHRVKAVALPRLWGFTMAGNLIAMAILALVLTQAGLVPPEALQAAGHMSDTFAERDWLGAGLSAVLAGTVMTLFTWLTHAVERDSARILIALLIGFLLAAPSLNHAIVGFGEMAFGVMAGTTETAGWVDVAQNFPIAVAGNLLGGLGFVTLTRILQVRGEPAHDPTAS